MRVSRGAKLRSVRILDRRRAGPKLDLVDMSGLRKYVWHVERCPELVRSSSDDEGGFFGRLSGG